MPSTTESPPPRSLAGSPRVPYTDIVNGDRTAASIPWWRDAVRAWAPVLGFAVLIVFQMVSLQRQIGELRTDFHREIGGLGTDVQKEIGGLRDEFRTEIGELREEVRTEIGELREEVRTEMGELREEVRTEIRALGERVTRLEALMELQVDNAAVRPVR